jgi:hypothetical protein
MTDWKSLAKTRRLNIPEPDIEKISSALDKLEEAFRPLAVAIPLDVEPAITFRAGEPE